jgi:hypothetical protein
VTVVTDFEMQADIRRMRGRTLSAEGTVVEAAGDGEKQQSLRLCLAASIMAGLRLDLFTQRQR